MADRRSVSNVVCVAYPFPRQAILDAYGGDPADKAEEWASAARAGTEVHTMIESVLKSPEYRRKEPVDELVAQLAAIAATNEDTRWPHYYIDATTRALEWLAKRRRLTIVATEKELAHDFPGVGELHGVVDCIVTYQVKLAGMSRTVHCLIDWKTGVHQEKHRLQLGLYALLYSEETGIHLSSLRCAIVSLKDGAPAGKSRAFALKRNKPELLLYLANSYGVVSECPP